MTSNADWRQAYDGTLGPALRECLLAAIAAPSIHNTQPWRFKPRNNGVDLFVDRTRQLGVIDPYGREALMSLGACLFNLRVAVLGHGRMPLVRLLPEPDQPDQVARVTFGPPTPVTATVRSLVRAVPRRHTNRRPFTSVSIPGEVLTELVASAAIEGGHLAVADPAARDAVLSLVRLAERHAHHEASYLKEIGEWTAPSPSRQDGIPQEAYGPWSAMEIVPIRDFGLVEPARHRHVETFEPEPTIAVLYATGDSPRDWLKIGQALERTLLTATVRGVATTLMTQPIEVPRLRMLLSDTTAALVPQAIVRFGYGPPGTPTPRRPLEQVVDGMASRPTRYADATASAMPAAQARISGQLRKSP
ncbi:MAG: Acg family FMN-binding oxidoreductase [Micromonosporaceae bacterium]